MSKKYVLALVILIVVGLSVGVWALSLSPTSTPTQTVDNSTEHTNPNWTFPWDNEPTTPLPDFRPVVAKVMPSVVSVTTKIVASDLFGRPYTDYVSGSGILIDSNGYIATNNHVVCLLYTSDAADE